MILNVQILKKEFIIMIISILLVILSPFTAFLPILYMTYEVITKKAVIHKNPWNIGLLLLFSWSVFSSLVNLSFYSVILSFVILIYFFLSIYLQNHFNDEDKIEGLCRYLVYFSIGAAVIGIIEKIIFTYFDSSLWSRLLGVASEIIANHRIYSTFGNPNIAGTWFATMILVCLYFSGNKTGKNKLFYQSSVFLFLFALYLTGSRGASIGLLTGLIAYYAIKRNKGSLIAPAILIILLAVLAFGPSQILNINNMMGRDFNSSFDSRFSIWIGCLNMFKHKPITGWGMMGIYDYGLNYIHYHTKVYHGQNIWITLLATLGIVGLAIYIHMKLYLYRSIITLYKLNCRLVPLLAGIQALVVGHGIVDFAIMTPQAGLMFIGCSAIISSLVVKYTSSLDPKPLPLPKYNILSRTG